MSVIEFSGRFFVRVLVLMALSTAGAFVGAAMLGWIPASTENGIVENYQLLLLAVSLMAGTLAAIWSRHLLRVAMAGWTVLSLLLIQREIDFSMLGRESWLHAISDLSLRLAFWLPVFALVLICALPYWRFVLRSVAALRWVHLWPTVLTGALMVASELAEQMLKAGIFHSHYRMLNFMEEVLEMNGYCVIAATAVAIAARTRRPASAEAVAARNRLDPAG